MAKSVEIGATAAVITRFGTANAGSEDGLTAAEICLAYKAALEDFISGKANRKAVAEIGKLLAGALAARRQMLSERNQLTSQRCHQFFYNN